MEKQENNHDRPEKRSVLKQKNSMLNPESAKDGSQDSTPILLSKLQQITEVSTVVKVMSGFVIAAIIVIALYVGKEILIPLALAILFGFLLDPLVSRLKRMGLPKLPSIALVVLCTLGILGGAATYLVSQLGDLSQELPQYQSTISQKLNSIKSYAKGPSIWDGAITTIETVEHSVTTANQKKQDNPNIQQVEVVDQNHSMAESVVAWGEKVLSPLTTAGIVFVFVVLILLDRKDLHDRLLRLFGANLNVGTDALDEAANRIGKYLRMQLIVNMTYGVPMAIGLWFIGVPAAIMWGMVAVVMRFVPYVGPLISAVFPITLAFAVDPGWSMVLWALTLVLVLELITNNIIEPWLYGESTGLSTLAIMVAATFWTTIWGPIGLILSTPLTACILVLSNYVPALAFVKVLIGNTPALKPPERFYQRLVADDVDAAMDVAIESVEQELPKKPSKIIVIRKIIDFYEEVAIPAIVLFSTSHNQAATAEHRLRMNQGLKLFNRDFQKKYTPEIIFNTAKVFCIGARWEIDVQVSAMMAHALQLKNIAAASIPQAMIQSQLNALDEIPHDAEMICISIFHENPLPQIRLIHQRVREKFADAKLIFATWNCDVNNIQDEVKKRFDVDAIVDDVNELILTVEAFLIQDGQNPIPQLLREDEPQRLEALHQVDLLNEKNLPIYEQYIEETAQAFDVSFAQISWVDQDWVNIPASPFVYPRQNLMNAKIPRIESVCTHLVYQDEDLIIEDIKRDPRFEDNTELRKNHIRFYAGVPLRNKKGIVLGSLSILDKQPRVLDSDDVSLLHELASDLMQTLSDEKKRDAKLQEIKNLEHEPFTSLDDVV